MARELIVLFKESKAIVENSKQLAVSTRMICKEIQRFSGVSSWFQRPLFYSLRHSPDRAGGGFAGEV